MALQGGFGGGMSNPLAAAANNTVNISAEVQAMNRVLRELLNVIPRCEQVSYDHAAR